MRYRIIHQSDFLSKKIQFGKKLGCWLLVLIGQIIQNSSIIQVVKKYLYLVYFECSRLVFTFNR